MPEIADTTEVLMERELVVYRRERSNIWQCRFKVDGVWQRATTKERDLAKAKVKAKELMIEAEIRKRSNLPVINRKFRVVANLAIERMQQEQAAGKGKVSFKDYIRIITDVMIPCLGKRNITSIDYAALDELDTWRIESPRVLRRLQLLREWSHEEINQIFPGSPGTRSSDGAGAPEGLPLAMGGHRIDCTEDWLRTPDLA